MKRNHLAISAIALAAALGTALALVQPVGAASSDTGSTVTAPAPGYGPGDGHGYGRGYGRGPGMGGRGMGPDRAWAPGAGPGPRAAYWADADRDGVLTVEEVKSFVESRHAAMGWTDVDIAKVEELDENTIVVQIADEGGNTVRSLEFPKKVDAAAASRPGRPGYGRGRGGYGPGMRGGYGPGMGGGYGPGGVAAADGEVTVDEVRALLEQRLATRANANLKVGDVTETERDTILAEIVTQDGSLVRRVEFDRKTGRPVWNR